MCKPEQFGDLPKYRIGLADLAKFTHGMDIDLKHDDFDTRPFEQKILKYQPQYVCFNGKEAAKMYLDFRHTKQVNYGLQTQVINQTKLFVAPSASIKAIAHWDERIWQQLKDLID